MDSRAAILRAKCYPLQVDRVSQDDIKQWLAELVAADLIVRYQANGGEYLQMRTWERHQQIRAKRSKYPDMQSSDINCDQMQSDVPVIQSNTNPIQTNAPAVAVPAAHVPLAERFHDLLAELKTTDNKSAKLREIYIACFGESEVPDFGYLGKVAKQVGGAGRLAELFWQYSAKPPTGDVLAYIQKAHKQTESNGNGRTGNGSNVRISVPGNGTRYGVKDLANG